VNIHPPHDSKAGKVALGLALVGLLLLVGGLTSYATPPTLSAGGSSGPEQASDASAAEADAQLALPTDQIILKYRAAITEKDAFNPASTAQMDRLSEAAGVPLTYVREMSGDAYVLGLPERMPLAEVQAIADRLGALAEVEYAEPDAIMVPMLTPNDPQYANQWHYFAPGPGHYGINAPAAWDITTGSASVVVAVIDTGITNHADLSGRTVPGYDFVSGELVANDGSGRDGDPSDPGDWITNAENSSGYFQGCTVTDSSWHGTHTAGTVGAASNNGAGVAGVNWNSKILPVRVLGKCGGFTSDIADGMRWAAGLSVSGAPANANPAKVINLSLGGSGACGTTYQDAVNAIVAAGTTLVISAGNSNADASGFRPGNCTGVITIAATNRDGGRAYYSNYGSTIEISAPGGAQGYANDPNGVLSTLNTGTQGPVADTYEYYQGTSMAAPHVAGVVSLLYSRKPSLTPAEVLTILQNTVTAFPSGSTCTTANCGSGIVNAGAAVAAVANPVPAISGLNPSSATPGGPGFTLTVNGTGFVGNSVVRWNGASRTTTYVSGTQLTAAITATDIVSAGTRTVTVFNPAPGGGESNAVSFSVGNPVPAISGFSPPWTTPGGPDFTLTINGTGFVSGAVVRWNGAPRTTTYMSGTQLKAAITAADIASEGTRSVTVFNPAPGGGESNPVSYLVGSPKRVYLPLVVRSLAAPVLNAISNADGDGNYAVCWSAVAEATSYALEEDDNAGFTSPTAVYTGAGTCWNASNKPMGTYYYRVRAATASASSGWSNVQSTTVSPACTQTIQNPGFESGPVLWQQYSTHGWDIIINSGFPGSVTPRTGSWAAWEGGEFDDISYIQQTVTVSCPYLVYWHWIASQDSCGYDFAGVLVNGAVVDVYNLCSSANTSGWAKHVVNLSAYVGQTVQLQIRTECDDSLNSNLFVDDVSFQGSAAVTAAEDTRSPSAGEWQLKSAQGGPRQGAAPSSGAERVFSQATSPAR
jgi:serine protease